MPSTKKQARREREQRKTRGVPHLPEGSSATGEPGKIHGPYWLYHHFPWPSDDPRERLMYAAQLFCGALSSDCGEPGPSLHVMQNVMSDFLTGQRHFVRFAHRADHLAYSRVDGTPMECGGAWRRGQQRVTRRRDR